METPKSETTVASATRSVACSDMARLLAESWRRRAEIYAATEGQVGENIRATYRICAVELAALVAETEKQPSEKLSLGGGGGVLVGDDNATTRDGAKPLNAKLCERGGPVATHSREP